MMRMEHGQRLVQKPTQTLVLTQKMQQALRILQLNSTELQDLVQQELEDNPFLDLVEKANELPDPKEATPNEEDDKDRDSSFDLDEYADRWEKAHKEGRDLSRNEDLFARRQYYEDSITKEESLPAHLMDQLRLTVEDAALFEVCERIIINDINERGYFTGDEAAIAEEMTVDPSLVEKALKIIQSFEPTGVGAHDTAECLLLQIEAEYPEEKELKTLVRDHLDALTHRQIPQIARAMKIKPERVEELKDLLSTLDPWPGYIYTSEPPQYVTPDVVVEKVNDEYLVRLVDERIPDLRVNKDYQRAVTTKGLSEKDKEYIREKMDAARFLKRNIAQRQQTILKVAEAIVAIQRDFLDKGIEHIKPLTLQNIADVVGVHESTVARTTRGKYMQTPQGLYELKYFFSPSVSQNHGAAQASKAVQAMVKKTIDEEDKHSPLSDKKIADILKEKHGIDVARRTVTKYREALGILKTTMRKQY